ncbi:MAG TPA: hypothetical protein VK071_11645 [Tissierellales bacterium]|nr:hypothetical protein [Tissierellales bacterium]
MGKTYCIYKGKKYSYNIEGEMIRIISDEDEESFENYIDLMGNVAEDLFSKLVSPDELDIICSEEHEFKYRGEYFIPRAISQKVLKENKILLATDSEKVAKELDFIMAEQFVFEKEVSFEDITELLITRKPLFEFEDRGIEKIIIPQNKIKRYIEKYLEEDAHEMIRRYCIYEGKKYYFEPLEEKIEIISDNNEKDFKNYVTVTGKVSDDFFSKLVAVGELDDIYLERYEVKYKNRYVGLLVINQEVIRKNKIVLYTQNEKVTKELGLMDEGYHDFVKEVNFDDIKELVITREPLEEYKEKFKNIDTKKVVKSKGEIKEYIREYLKIEVPM